MQSRSATISLLACLLAGWLLQKPLSPTISARWPINKSWHDKDRSFFQKIHISCLPPIWNCISKCTVKNTCIINWVNNKLGAAQTTLTTWFFCIVCDVSFTLGSSSFGLFLWKFSFEVDRFFMFNFYYYRKIHSFGTNASVLVLI